MLNPTELLTSGRCFKKAYEKMLAAPASNFGLSKSEVDVLLFLYNNPGFDTAKDIVELRMLPKSYVSKAVDTLVQKRYLDVTADRDDRRLIHLALTEAAVLAARSAKAAQSEFITVLSQGITEEEKELFGRITKKMTNNVLEVLQNDI